MAVQSGEQAEANQVSSASLPPVRLPSNLSRFSEKDITHIAEALNRFNPAWSTLPRTYIVLWLIGEPMKLADFIKSEFSDYWLPASRNQLPTSLNHETKIKFLQTQKHVMTDTTDLTLARGPHKHLDRETAPMFHFLRLLGSGGLGQVEEVLHWETGQHFACKKIPRRVFRGRSVGMDTFMAELGILKRLHHHHIAKLMDSYTDPQFLGIIMTPVADCNLSEYLSSASTQSQGKCTIRTFFGCLASALAYLHRSKIRHKDVKPQNVLVKDDRVLLTDFGISRDWNAASGDTTEGPTHMSPRYSSPEVADRMPRNSSSDIWSLGCIFVEMLTVLKGETVQAMRLYFETHGTESPFFYNNPEATNGWLTELRDKGQPEDNAVLDWVTPMLSHDRNTRPVATYLLKTIQSAATDASKTWFCGTYCIGIGDLG